MPTVQRLSDYPLMPVLASVHCAFTELAMSGIAAIGEFCYACGCR